MPLPSIATVRDHTLSIGAPAAEHTVLPSLRNDLEVRPPEPPAGRRGIMVKLLTILGHHDTA